MDGRNGTHRPELPDDGQPDVDRQQRQLPARLRPDESGGERRVRTVVVVRFRQHGRPDADRSGRPERMGRATVRLAVRHRRPAADSAAHVGRGQLQPAVVQRLFRVQEHAAQRRRFLVADDRGAAEREPARRRRISDDVSGARTRACRRTFRTCTRAPTTTAARSVYWHGVDITISSRMHNGFVFQGGTSTGRGVTDFCALAGQMPEIYNPALTNAANNLASTPYQPTSACHVAENWLTQFRGLASYQIPEDRRVVQRDRRNRSPTRRPGRLIRRSGSNGTSLAANFSQRRPARRPTISSSRERSTDRASTLVDLRAAKVLNFGRYKATAGVDLYNLLQLEHGAHVQSELRHRVELSAADDDPDAAFRETERDCRLLMHARRDGHAISPLPASFLQVFEFTAAVTPPLGPRPRERLVCLR